MFLLKRLLAATETKVPIINSKIALKQKEFVAQESIKNPHTIPVKAQVNGEAKIEKAVRIGKISNGVIPFIVRGKIPV